jgi:hypothetical protein
MVIVIMIMIKKQNQELGAYACSPFTGEAGW